MRSYKFTMPFPPSVNVWKSPFRNRMILTARGRAYRAEAIKAMQSLNLDNEALSGRLEVHLTLNPKTNRKYDIDNFCKSLFDAITKSGFWVDDEQIDKLVVKKGKKVKGGRVQVSVFCL